MSTPTLEWLAGPFDHVVDRRVWCWCAQVGDPALTSRVLTMLQTKKSHSNPTAAGKAGGADADAWSLEAHWPELVTGLAAQITEGVGAVLQERKKELAILGIALRRKLKPVEVLIDPTVAHTFVNAVLDWGMPFGNRVDVRMDLNAWPQHARLQMRVSNDGVPPSSVTSSDNLSWMLIRQIALGAGGIEISRRSEEHT